MNDKLDNIQFLRALAAILVVASHLTASVMGRSAESGIEFNLGEGLSFGGFGVDIFFVISGFIMVYISEAKKSTSQINFLIKRGIRIYPIYWVCSLALLIFYALPLTKVAPPDIVSVIKSFFLFPEINTEGKMRPSLVGQGWTLIFELYFYLVFSFALKLSLEKKTLLTAGLILCVFLLANTVGLGVFNYVLGNSLCFEFVLGMLIAVLMCKGYALIGMFKIAAYVLMLVSCTLVIFDVSWWCEQDRLIAKGVPAFFIVLVFVLDKNIQKIRFSKLSNLLGNASYSIYLTHMIGIIAFSIIWKRDWLLGERFASYVGLDVYFGILLLGLCFIGVLFYWCVEKPMMKLSRFLF